MLSYDRANLLVDIVPVRFQDSCIASSGQGLPHVRQELDWLDFAAASGLVALGDWLLGAVLGYTKQLLAVGFRPTKLLSPSTQMDFPFSISVSSETWLVSLFLLLLMLC